MMIGWIIIIPLILIALWYFSRNKIDSSAKKEKSLIILKKYFAAGEITSKEYEERKAELEK
ncbi:MAG: putative membrane protein [Flavobacterium sp.]|jgi:uncharacterized membrane protein